MAKHGPFDCFRFTTPGAVKLGPRQPMTSRITKQTSISGHLMRTSNSSNCHMNLIHERIRCAVLHRVLPFALCHRDLSDSLSTLNSDSVARRFT